LRAWSSCSGEASGPITPSMPLRATTSAARARSVVDETSSRSERGAPTCHGSTESVS
jgi:hypothetical protein